MTRMRNIQEVALPLVNMAFRGASLAGRFILSVYLAKYVGLRSVGVFGLISGIVGLAPAILGLGLNYFMNREIIDKPVLDAGHKIRDRLLVTVFMVVLAVAVGFGLWAAGLLESDVNVYLLVLVVALETVAFDIHMSIISLRMPVFANFLIFIRSSSWIYPYILIGFFFPAYRTVEFMLSLWGGALFFNYLVLLVKFRGWPWVEILAKPVDLTWVSHRRKAVSLVYLSDIGIVGSIYADRFAIESVAGLELTGIFMFFWSLANAVQTLVNTAVIQVAFPRLVSAYKGGSESGWSHILRNELIKVFLGGIAASACVYFATRIILPHLGREQLMSMPLLLPSMLFAALLRLLSDVLNCGLYSRGMDKPWAMTNILGVGLSLGTTFAAIVWFGLEAVGAGMATTAATLLVARSLILYGAKIRLPKLARGS